MKANNAWQAEMDAETLMRYNEIIGNKNRYAKAVRSAQSRANEYRRKAEALGNVGNSKANGGKMTRRKK